MHLNPLIYNLGRCDLFAGIPVGQLEDIFSKVKHRIRRFLPGELIEEQGSSCEEMLVLLLGEVKAQMQDFSGKVVQIERIKAPSILASGFIFAKDRKLPVDIVAIDHVTILYMEKTGIISICGNNERFLVNLLGDMGNRLTTLAEKVWLLSLNTISQKLAHFLLKKASENGPEFELKITREELADAFGVARPSLSRVFGEFASEGIIGQDGKKIRVLDEDALKRIVGEPADL